MSWVVAFVAPIPCVLDNTCGDLPSWMGVVAYVLLGLLVGVVLFGVLLLLYGRKNK